MSLPKLVEQEEHLRELSDEVNEVLASLFMSKRVQVDFSKLRLTSSYRLQEVWVLHAADVDRDRLLEILPALAGKIPPKRRDAFQKRLGELGFTIKLDAVAATHNLERQEDFDKHQRVFYQTFTAARLDTFVRFSPGVRKWAFPQEAEENFQKVCLEAIRKNPKDIALIRAISGALPRLKKVNPELFAEVTKGLKEEQPLEAARSMMLRISSFHKEDCPQQFIDSVIQGDIKLAIGLFQEIAITNSASWLSLLQKAVETDDQKTMESVYTLYLRKGRDHVQANALVYQLWDESLDTVPPQYSEEVLMGNQRLLQKYMSQTMNRLKTEKNGAKWKEGCDELERLWTLSKKSENAFLVTLIYLELFSGNLPAENLILICDRMSELMTYIHTKEVYKDKSLGRHFLGMVGKTGGNLSKKALHLRKGNAKLFDQVKRNVAKACNLVGKIPVPVEDAETIIPIWISIGDKESLDLAMGSLNVIIPQNCTENMFPILEELVDKLLEKRDLEYARDAYDFLSLKAVPKRMKKEVYSRLLVDTVCANLQLQKESDPDMLLDLSIWSMFLNHYTELLKELDGKKYMKAVGEAYILLFRISVRRLDLKVFNENVLHFQQKITLSLPPLNVYNHMLTLYQALLRNIVLSGPSSLASMHAREILQHVRGTINQLLSDFETNAGQDDLNKVIMSQLSDDYLKVAELSEDGDLIREAQEYQVKLISLRKS